MYILCTSSDTIELQKLFAGCGYDMPHQCVHAQLVYSQLGLQPAQSKGPKARGSARRYFGNLSGINDGKPESKLSNLRVFYLERNSAGFFSFHLSNYVLSLQLTGLLLEWSFPKMSISTSRSPCEAWC